MKYRDADGDSYGSASTSISSCTQPPGYVAVTGDCDDANPSTYSAAPERNDGVDNQCPGNGGYGSIDEISGVTGFLTPGNKTTLSWPAQSGATSYDVARSPFRDFHAGCRISSTAVPSLSDPEVPPRGAAFYYLVRAAAPWVGSWGKRSSGVERTVCTGCVSGADQCDDNNTCTVGDTCSATVCVSGPPRNCDDGNPCTDDSCNPVSGCAHVNNSSSCDDGNACTAGDVCSGGICSGTPPAMANHLVISQIQTSGSSPDDEFIEIYNPTPAPVDLSGWSLQRLSNPFPFNADIQTLGPGTIPAHGWYLVARAGYDGSPASDRTNFAFSLSSTSDSIFLVHATSSPGSCSGATIVDKVGYGFSANCPEGAGPRRRRRTIRSSGDRAVAAGTAWTRTRTARTSSVSPRRHRGTLRAPRSLERMGAARPADGLHEGASEKQI